MMEKIYAEELIEDIKKKSLHRVDYNCINRYEPMVLFENMVKSFCEEINKVIDEINKVK